LKARSNPSIERTAILKPTAAAHSNVRRRWRGAKQGAVERTELDPAEELQYQLGGHMLHRNPHSSAGGRALWPAPPPQPAQRHDYSLGVFIEPTGIVPEQLALGIRLKA